MKPSQPQKNIINTISRAIKSWESSNDFDSPSVVSDALEEIRKCDELTEDDQEYLEIVIQGVYSMLKRI